MIVSTKLKQPGIGVVLLTAMASVGAAWAAGPPPVVIESTGVFSLDRGGPQKVNLYTFQIPYLADPLYLEVSYEGRRIDGVVMSTKYQGTHSFKDQYLQPVRLKLSPGQPSSADQDRVVIEVQGQSITGRLFVAPLKDRNNQWIDPTNKFAEYLVATEAKQEFVYNKTAASNGAKDRALLFQSANTSTNAQSTQTENGHWKVTVGQGEKARLTFGRIIEPRRAYHSWQFNDKGIGNDLKGR